VPDYIKVDKEVFIVFLVSLKDAIETMRKMDYLKKESLDETANSLQKTYDAGLELLSY